MVYLESNRFLQRLPHSHSIRHIHSHCSLFHWDWSFLWHCLPWSHSSQFDPFRCVPCTSGMVSYQLLYCYKTTFNSIFDNRIGIVRLLLIILGGIMATLALIMLVVGCLATGSTRHSVYRAWKARVGGRLSCAIVRSINIFYSQSNLTLFL